MNVLLVAFLNIVGIPLPDGSPSIAIAVVADEPIRTSLRNEIAAKLRDTGKAGPIASDDLPPLTKLDDASIIRLVRGVEVVIVARARDDGRVQLVYYAREGTAVGSLALELSAVPRTSLATMPVPPRVETQAEVEQREMNGLPLALQGKYWNERIGFLSHGNTHRGTTALSHEELYQALDRPDVVRRIAIRQRVRTALVVLGPIAFGGGLATMVGNALAHPQGCWFAEKCPPQPPAPVAPYAVGGVVTVVGMAACVIAMALPRGDLPESEQYRLVREYNERLRKRLLQPSVSLAPVAGREMVGVVASGRF
jgi:hypothetical protein